MTEQQTLKEIFWAKWQNANHQNIRDIVAESVKEWLQPVKNPCIDCKNGMCNATNPCEEKQKEQIINTFINKRLEELTQ